LFTRILIALEFHVEITDLAQRPSSWENNRLEGFAKRAREARGLASLYALKLLHLWRCLPVLGLDPLFDFFDRAHPSRAVAQRLDRIRVGG
jgi:hypothetical protein